jgi:zinc transport system substrate-binding protein
MAALAEASIYFRIGVPFEQVWMDRLQATTPGLRIVDTRQGIELRGIEAHVHDEAAQMVLESLGGAAAQKDPHIWTSPPLLIRQAQTITGALVESDPDGAPIYRANLDTLERRLEALDADLERLLAPYQGRSFLVFHPSWGYFADRYDLRQLPIELGGKSPSARELAEIIELARREQIGAVLVQRQFSQGAARTVARAIGGEVLVVDPLAEDVIGNLREVAGVIIGALDE